MPKRGLPPAGRRSFRHARIRARAPHAARRRTAPHRTKHVHACAEVVPESAAQQSFTLPSFKSRAPGHVSPGEWLAPRGLREFANGGPPGTSKTAVYVMLATQDNTAPGNRRSVSLLEALLDVHGQGGHSLAAMDLIVGLGQLLHGQVVQPSMGSNAIFSACRNIGDVLTAARTDGSLFHAYVRALFTGQVHASGHSPPVAAVSGGLRRALPSLVPPQQPPTTHPSAVADGSKKK